MLERFSIPATRKAVSKDEVASEPPRQATAQPPLRGPSAIIYGQGGQEVGAMVRTALLICIAVICAAPVRAQTPGPDNEDARYTFNRADDGYLRLDGRTGQVSFCTRRAVGWACQAVPDERTALEAEITRLQGENAALKKEMLAHSLPLPGTVKPDAPAAKPEEPRLQLPSDPELNRMMGFLEKVWRRLVDMIVSLQKDVLNKS
jgi:hypothetical protein